MKPTVLFAAALVAGCYSPPFEPCTVVCADDGACPSGLSCGGDGFCSAPGVEADCAGVCVPTTCAAAGATCGRIDDECGGVLDCGACPGDPDGGPDAGPGGEFDAGGGEPDAGVSLPFEVVAEVLSSSASPAVALAADGTVHVVVAPGFFTDPVVHARRAGPGAWDVLDVDAAGDLEPGADLVIDGAGALHASYAVSEGMRHGILAPGAAAWTVEAVPTSTGHFPSLVLDSAGRAHMVFVRLAAADFIAHAVRSTAGVWGAAQEVDDDTPHRGPRPFTALAIGPGDALHAVYRAEAAGRLRYARKSATGDWIAETIPHAIAGATYADLAVDATGTAHLLFVAAGSVAHSYATRSPAGVWSDPELIDDSGAFGGGASLALDDDGRPHAAYLRQVSDVPPSDVRHARRLPGGTWSVDIVDDTEDIGLTDVVVDADGCAHIVYTAQVSLQIRYVRRCP